MRSRGGDRAARVAVVAATAGLAAALIVPLGVAGASKAKAFPIGCWKARGAGYLQGRIEISEGLTINISSEFTFSLRVAKSKATGKMDYAATGTAQKDVGSGVIADVTISATASPTLAGTPSHVVIKGPVHFTGKIELSLGTSTPLDFTRQMTESLTILRVAKNKVSGGIASATAHWTALRKPCH